MPLFPTRKKPSCHIGIVIGIAIEIACGIRRVGLSPPNPIPIAMTIISTAGD
jgi:hypothetical protein